MKAGNTIDLVANSLKSEVKALVTVEIEFLNDPFMSDLVEGQFKVLGKVIKTVNAQEDPISFIRKSALSKMPGETLNDIMDGFNELGNSFQLPNNNYELNGPAFQVIPIAIYA